MAAGAATLWYRDPAARRAIALRFLPWFATRRLLFTWPERGFLRTGDPASEHWTRRFMAAMMDGGMGSMMGWVAALGGLGALFAVVLLISGLVALVRLLSPKPNVETGGGLRILVIVFAVIGALAVAGAAAMLLLHWSMGGMMGCC